MDKKVSVQSEIVDEIREIMNLARQNVVKHVNSE